MTTRRTNPKVDAVLAEEEKWRKEFTKLRKIVLSVPLEEELKWGCPCYTYEGRNIVLMHGFKEYSALLYHKGALLENPKGILVQQTKRRQSPRQIRFTNVREVDARAKDIKAYVERAL